MKKRPTFFEGVGLALLISIVGAAGVFTLSSLFGGGAFRLFIAGLSFTYVVYLLVRSHERVGKVTVISTWLLIAALNGLFVSSLLLYLLIHLSMIWLIRSLYFYNSVLSALLDLGLTAISMTVAIWAWSMSQSLFLSFWCFFLLQALFVVIPRQLKKTIAQSSERSASHDAFEHAHRAAETAVRKLSSNYSQFN